MQSAYVNYLKPGLSGKLIGKGHDIENGVPEGSGVTAFGLFLARGTIAGRVRLPESGDVVTDIAGVFKYTHVYPRLEDGTYGIPQYKDGDVVRKGKIYLPGETGLAVGDTLHLQLVEEAVNSRYVGFTYSSASGTGGNSIDISSIAKVYKAESNGQFIAELLIW